MPEFPESNGLEVDEKDALQSLRGSILPLIEDRREDALASLGNGEELIPLALARTSANSAGSSKRRVSPLE